MLPLPIFASRPLRHVMSALLLLAGMPAAAVANTNTAAVAPNSAASPTTIPPRPEQLVFPPLLFQPPNREAFRRVLPDGSVVYLAPSHEFPLITLTFTFKGGASLDPADMPGLASLTAQMVREGGTQTRPPAQLDESLDFLATLVSVGAGDTFTTATMNSLTNNFAESLGLLLDMLRRPAFDATRLASAKARLIEGLKQRNDDASSILNREWQQLLYGTNHFAAREPTDRSVARITPARLRTLHQQLFHPGNLIIAVTGDFDEPTMLATLTQALAGWERGALVPDPPPPTHLLAPGLYHVAKTIPQGKVVLGMRGIRRDDPDAIALQLLNYILGNGGFTSRLMQQVRSKAGLAYSVRSTLTPEVYYPGDFRAGFASKNASVARATQIVLDQIRDLRETVVTPAELATAQQNAIETFPRRFENKTAMLQLFVNDEWTQRPKDYWVTYRERVRAVTREELLRVAKQHLDPSKMAILVVGDWAEIVAGEPDQQANMRAFFGGVVQHLPLRDPLTLAPLGGSCGQ
jgi:zinc protease